MKKLLFVMALMVLAILPFAAAQTNEGQTINGSFLWITDVEVDVCNRDSGCDDDKDLSDGDKISEEAGAGATVEFDIEVTNVYDILFPDDKDNDNDIEIEDIEVEITIEDVDDGDEIDMDADLDDLDVGDDDNVKVEFELPLEVEEGDYDVVIIVDADSPNGSLEARMELTLEVEKEDNEVIFTRFSLTPSEVQCSRTVSVDASVLNVGNDDEDEVTLDIISNELELNFNDDFELETDFDDDARYSKNYRFTLEQDVKPGVYPFTGRVTFDDGRETETKTADLVVGNCEATSEEAEEDEKEEDDREMEDEKDEEEDNEVVVVRPSTDNTNNQPPVVVTPPQLPPQTEEEESLFKSNSFLTLLIVGEILLVIIAIVIIVAVMRKRD